jgi:signal transduction histidine kinase
VTATSVVSAVAISFADTGRGIDPATLPRIFRFSVREN